MRRLIALALCLSGCVTRPAPIRNSVRSPPAVDGAGYYDYSPVPLRARVEAVESRAGCTLQRITLVPAGAEGSAATRLGAAAGAQTLPSLRVDWYRPARPGRQPAVVMSPILADNDLYLRAYARFYAARGLHAVLVYRQKEVFSAGRPLTDIEKHLRESIVEIRRVIDWLQTQETVDSERIGSFAVSMGAILTSILAGVEPRIRCSILGLPAGRLAEILMSSQDKGIRKRRNNYLKETNRKPKEVLDELRRIIVSEPLRFAPAADPARILLIAGRFDRVLGLGRSLELWRAMGRPRLILLPTGHYSAALATPYLKRVTYSFLRRQLR